MESASSVLAAWGWRAQDGRAARILKQLILTADDFGRTVEVNAAIERAHRAGFLTQASLMVNEAAVEDALEVARRNPELCVGLHLTVCAGRASRVSALTNAEGRFRWAPTPAGIRYFFLPGLARTLEAEIAAQFDRFLDLGFASGYWDGHKHFHLHPTVLRLATEIGAEKGFCWMRLMREPGPAAILPAIFQALSRAALPQLERHGIGFADRVFGLRTTGRMSTETIERILRGLPEGISEIYFHPGAEREEINYGRLAGAVRELGIGLTSTRELSGLPEIPP